MPTAHSHWLVKSDPDTYGWDELVKDGKTRWDGVRNAQARNNLQAMRVGDLALFYHSGESKRPKGARSEQQVSRSEPKASEDHRTQVSRSEPKASEDHRAGPSEARSGREIVGVAKVVRAAYPDPTADDEQWVAVDIAPVAPLRTTVALADVKRDAALAEIALVRQGRLSVMPIAPRAFARILALGKTKL